MAKLWSRRPYIELHKSMFWFYRDGALRIFPLYFTALGMSVVVWICGAQSPFFERAPGIQEWVANFTVIPLMGLLNTDWYGYRLLIGVLFIFLSGVLIERRTHSGTATLCALLIYIVFLYKMQIRRGYDMEVAFGYLVGLPLIILLGNIRLKSLWYEAQREAGNISYGLFVFHFPVLWVLEIFNVPDAIVLPLVLVVSLVLSGGCHYGVERPIWRRFRSQVPLELPSCNLSGKIA